MKGSALTVIIIIVAIVALIGMGAFIFLKSSSNTPTPSSSNTSTVVSPAVPVKDYAPNLPTSQKTTILIQTSDSSDIKYIVPSNQISTYVKSLPPGYHVISQ